MGENDILIYLAQFANNTIFISGPMLRELEEALRKIDRTRWLGAFDAESVLIAHELFHYIESVAPVIATRTLQVQGGGWLKRKFCPSCSSEIGAFAFSRRLTGLGFFPRPLEVVGLYPRYPAEAAELVRRVERQCGS